MSLYITIETLFERMANAALRLFGNSIVFMAAVVLVIVWFCVHDWHHTTLVEGIYHIIIAITFLSFFIIQRTFTHFSQAMHLKLNELVTANENAHNHVIRAEQISGEEMKEMAKAHELIIAAEEEPSPSKIIIL
jgi:low affinity Fe/Cu permease